MTPEQKTALRKASDKISSVRSDIEGIRDQLQEALDDLSEKAQDEGPRGEALQDDINVLEEVISHLEDAEDGL